MLLSVMHDFPCVSCNITTKAKLFKKAIQKETNLSASNNCDFLQFDCAMSFCKEWIAIIISLQKSNRRRIPVVTTDYCFSLSFSQN